MKKQKVTVLITDLDDTLYDWVEMWYQSFSAMLNKLVELSGVPREKLIAEIKQIHQRHKTAAGGCEQLDRVQRQQACTAGKL